MHSQAQLLFYPLFAMALLTFSILILLAKARFTATQKGEVSPKFYRLFQGGAEPDHVLKFARNLSNLCETPMLFYTAVLVTISLRIEHAALLYLAWAYVAARYTHSFIHCTYNGVLDRFRVFLLSVTILIAYWFTLLFILFSA